MLRYIVFPVLILFLAGQAFAEEMEDFLPDIGEYFNIPDSEVAAINNMGIPDEEMAVSLFISTNAGVEPKAVVDLRLSGKPWADIILHFGLSPEILYVPITEPVAGTPYHKAYKHFKGPKAGWRKILLQDDDVINLVNLKFISAHYGIPPGQVIKLRAQGKAFRAINRELRKETKERAIKHKIKRQRGGNRVK